MSKKTGAVTLLLVTIAVNAAHGQDPDRPRTLRPLQAEVVAGGYWLGGVERIMRMRDELKLTEAQIAQLEEIRKQHVLRTQEMVELRSRVAAGQIEEDAMRAQLEQHNARFHQNAEQMRARIDAILTKEQRDLLDDRYSVPRARVPLTRERVGERLRPGELAPQLRLRERDRVLRRFDRLDSKPQYYWFGTPGGELRNGLLRRRGVL